LFECSASREVVVKKAVTLLEQPSVGPWRSRLSISFPSESDLEFAAGRLGGWAFGFRT
jgi:hypothetical protein